MDPDDDERSGAATSHLVAFLIAAAVGGFWIWHGWPLIAGLTVVGCFLGAYFTGLDERRQKPPNG